MQGKKSITAADIKNAIAVLEQNPVNKPYPIIGVWGNSKHTKARVWGLLFNVVEKVYNEDNHEMYVVERDNQRFAIYISEYINNYTQDL